MPAQARRRFSGSAEWRSSRWSPTAPAARAGLRAEELIFELGETRVERGEDIQRRMGAEAIGEPIALRVLRGARELRLALTPAELVS